MLHRSHVAAEARRDAVIRGLAVKVSRNQTVPQLFRLATARLKGMI
jgi:hypothetical protein